MNTQNSNTQALHDAGVSIWLDDLSRGRIKSGNLQTLLDTRNVTGVTTNPAIFASALAEGTSYEKQLSQLAATDANAETAVTEMTTDDVREACDILLPLHASSEGVDGRVSIEVDPRLARHTDETVSEARVLAEKVGRENLLVKIPATKEGLPAISAVLAEGISVNVTLIFSLTRYREVLNAWLRGLEQAHAAGKDLSQIHSVASFFVSRVDSEIDARLDALDLDDSTRDRVRGKAGVANARLAYRIFLDVLDTERWRTLSGQGARLQRPLWASTGTKDPSFPDTLYVTSLVAPHCVNTMPEATLEALADHGKITGNTITDTFEEADTILDEIGRLGVDYNEVVNQLEEEGLKKFVDAWEQLLAQVDQQLQQLR